MGRAEFPNHGIKHRIRRPVPRVNLQGGGVMKAKTANYYYVLIHLNKLAKFVENGVIDPEFPLPPAPMVSTNPNQLFRSIYDSARYKEGKQFLIFLRCYARSAEMRIMIKGAEVTDDEIVKLGAQGMWDIFVYGYGARHDVEGVFKKHGKQIPCIQELPGWYM